MTRFPEITWRFWVIKAVITAACVFWPDYLFDHLGKPATAAVITLIGGAAVTAQFRTARYRAWEFWSATLVFGVAGTEAANGLHLVLGVAYVVVAAVWSIALAALVAGWKIRIGTASLRRVDSVPAERFFWGCVLAASAVGTALTHMTPSWLIALPWLQVLLWCAVVGACALASRRLPAPAFWCGFVATRPLGTGSAFVLSSSLGLKPLVTTALFAVVSVALVGRYPAAAADRARIHCGFTTDRRPGVDTR